MNITSKIWNEKKEASNGNSNQKYCEDCGGKQIWQLNITKEMCYIDILKKLKGVIELYVNGANKEYIIRWMFFFHRIVGIRDINKFICAMLNYDVSAE